MRYSTLGFYHMWRLTAILLLSSPLWADAPVSFIHKGKHLKGLDLIQPVFQIKIGVVQEAGAPVQNQDFLQCKPEIRSQKIILNGEESRLDETILKCKDGVVFVIKGIEWDVK